ncbi:MAG: hypothetical protein JST00_17115 [Deltaproteobacteria bacterium]|nr:hypothetical protein [Deltaproteobacteria bacterium]
MDRVCEVFEVYHPTVPHGGRFKIKILERSGGDYLAVPNLFVKSEDGAPDYISGLGQTSAAALEDLLARLIPAITALTSDDDGIFEWADPRDF